MNNSSNVKILKRILKNDYLLNSFNKLYAIIIGVFSTAFITRYLGVYLKGEYSYLLQIVNVSVLILNFGIYQSYSYNYRKNIKNLFSKYTSIFLIQFIIYFVISVFIMIVMENRLYTLVFLLIPFNVLKLQMENIMIVENIRVKIKMNMFNMTFTMLMFAALFLFAKQDLIFPILIIIIVNLITVIVYLKSMRHVPKITDFSFEHFKSTFKFGYLPMITTLLVTLNYSVDIFFLRNISGSAEVGLYATAAGIVNYLWLIPDTFKDVLFSRVARKKSEESVKLSIKLSLISVVIAIISFVFLGKFIINTLYGIDFVEAYTVTIILFFGAISMIFFKIFGTVFLSEGKRWFFFIALSISVTINVILNIFLIPIYGMYGASIASVFSYSICGLSFLIYYARNKNLSMKELIFLNKKDLHYLKKIILG
jgi:O-antigen/teichoic acid export membrane protein